MLSKKVRMELKDTKGFWKVFRPFFNWNEDRAASRFLYSLTTALRIQAGDAVFYSDNFASKGYIVLVSAGLVNGYVIHEDKLHVDMWLGAENSVYIWNKAENGETGIFNIEAIENSMIFLIDLEKLSDGCQLYPVINKLFNDYFFRKAMKDVNERNILFRLQNEKSRAAHFKKMYAAISDRLPEELIRSYLTICEEA